MRGKMNVLVMLLFVIIISCGLSRSALTASWEDLGACFVEIKGWSGGEVTGLTVQQEGQTTTYAVREYNRGDARMAIKFQIGPSLTQDALTTTFPDTLKHCLMRCGDPCTGPCKCGPVVGEVNGYRIDTTMDPRSRLVVIKITGAGDGDPILVIEAKNMTECEVKKLASAIPWGCFYSKTQGSLQ